MAELTPKQWVDRHGEHSADFDWQLVVREDVVLAELERLTKAQQEERERVQRLVAWAAEEGYLWAKEARARWALGEEFTNYVDEVLRG